MKYTVDIVYIVDIVYTVDMVCQNLLRELLFYMRTTDEAKKIMKEIE